MKRYAETLFRHKLLFLLPAIVVPVVVTAVALVASSDYAIRSSVWVASDAASRSGASANQGEADSLRDLLRTDQFVDSVITEAGLDDQVNAGDWPQAHGLAAVLANIPVVRQIARGFGVDMPGSSDPVDDARREIRRTITIEASGQNLLHIRYRGGDAEIGSRIVGAVFTVFGRQLEEISQQESKAATAALLEQLTSRQKDLDDAEQALRSFQETHPAGPSGALLPADASREADLRRKYDAALSLYEDARRRLDDANSQASADLTAQRNRLRLLDEPRVPTSRDVRARDILTYGLFGAVFGLVIGLFPIIVMTWLDVTARDAKELTALTGVPVLATVPLLKRTGAEART